MKHLLLFALMSFALPAHGEDHVLNQLWAAMLATNLQRIEKPQDFADKMLLSPQDRALIEKEIKTGKMKDFSRPKISMPTDTKIVISQGTQNVEMELMDLHKGWIYINRSKIALNKATDFTQMQKLVQQALSRKTSAVDWILSEAFAADTNVYWYSVATAVSSTNRAYEMMYLDPNAKGFDIEQALSNTYEQMGMDAKKRADEKKKPVSLSGMRFTCQGKVAKDVYDGTIVRGKTVTDAKEDFDFSVHANAGHTRYNYQSVSCKSAWFDKKSLDFKSREENSTDGCPTEKSIKDDSMLKYMKLADMCCKKTNCDQNVQKKLASVTDELTGKMAAPAPVQEEQSPGTTPGG
jgi:hypothetical protein